MNILDLPLELKLRLLCSLPSFDSLLAFVECSITFRGVLLRYPRNVLVSIYKNSREEYIPRALALASLLLRLNAVPNMSAQSFDDCAAVPQFVTAWEEQSKQGVEQQIGFWLDAILEPNVSFSKLQADTAKLQPGWDNAFTLEAFKCLTATHNTTCAYTSKFISSELENLYDESFIEPPIRNTEEAPYTGGNKSTQCEPPSFTLDSFLIASDTERAGTIHAFYRLWLVCHLFRYCAYHSSGRDLLRQFLGSLESIWDAFGIQSVYNWMMKDIEERVTKPNMNTGEWQLQMENREDTEGKSKHDS